jgi:hypothetical protein
LVFDAVGAGPAEAEVVEAGAADVVPAVGVVELPIPGIAAQPAAVPTTRNAPNATQVALRPRSHRVPMRATPPL